MDLSDTFLVLEIPLFVIFIIVSFFLVLKFVKNTGLRVISFGLIILSVLLTDPSGSGKKAIGSTAEGLGFVSDENFSDKLKFVLPEDNLKGILSSIDSCFGFPGQQENVLVLASERAVIFGLIVCVLFGLVAYCSEKSVLWVLWYGFVGFNLGFIIFMFLSPEFLEAIIREFAFYIHEKPIEVSNLDEGADTAIITKQLFILRDRLV